MSLTAVYQQELRKTRTAVSNQVALHWNNLSSFRDKDLELFINRVVPIVETGQQRAVSLTDAYLSRMLGVQPLGLDLSKLTGASVRNGVSPSVVYARPFQTVWSSIATIGFTLAVQKGLSRLTSTAEMDVAMSARDTLVAYAKQNDSIIGYMRVADASCCDYCQMIDGARTGPDEPQPLHNGCGCSAEPIYGSDSISSDFTSFSAGSIFEDAEIHTHGELGPVITNKHYDFTGPNDLHN